jgi:hypothetical protein
MQMRVQSKTACTRCALVCVCVTTKTLRNTLCRGTVIFGYEQANKYTVYDETGAIVALVAEDYGGLGKEIGRQVSSHHGGGRCPRVW